MSHPKKAARLTAITLAAGLVLAAPAFAARRTPESDRPAPAGDPTLEPSDRDLNRGPYIDPNGLR